jgi:hypothetical protein
MDFGNLEYVRVPIFSIWLPGALSPKQYFFNAHLIEM